MQVPPPNGLITLLSDFGTRDPYVGIMKGVIKQRFGRAEIIDVCHDVPAQDVVTGGLFLRGLIGRFPTGTVHVAVVDPGVGTGRRALVVCAAGCYWVGPDNGVLSAVAAPSLRSPAGGEVREIDVKALRVQPTSATFHGRDVFAPVAAMLAGRLCGFRAVGPRVSDPIVEDQGSDPPRVLTIDHFGNLITSVHDVDVSRRNLRAVEVAGLRVPVVRTYRDAEPGQPLALINSYDLLEIAVSGGDAAAQLGVSRGDAIGLLDDQEAM